MRYKHALPAAALTAVLAVAGCSTNSDTANPASTSGGASPSPSSQQSFNDADVAFAQGMIPHHRQALEMAQSAATRAQDPKVKELAAEIEAAQGPEIQTMTGWLRSWGEPVPEDMTGMTGKNGAMTMPGMMSETDMDELMATTGTEFDKLFLTSMIEHHQGAIKMARTEQADGENADAVALAKRIASDQTAEIATTQRLLES